ncbi:MAG: sulfite exporter TauE/SafE family protein [Chitinophagales bacterium]|nr:sulfite exporter TauE/SafE family protein [Chitinophagales bacterium]MDW8419004.1 sulfite exporter TauE/SafE family protein [Chitinophagales bacterium]
MEITAAILLGLMGSMHCLGMCGPIALMLPLPGHSPLMKVYGAMMYNAGRAITYGTLGALFGLLGRGFVLAGYQQALSVAMGILIIAFFVIPASWKNRLSLLPAVAPVISRIKLLLGAWLQKKSYGSIWLIGLLNGLLPCGLVYVAIAGAMATGDVWHGAFFMILFGLGTTPAMLAIQLVSGPVINSWRSKFRNAVPMLVSVMAALLILRGLNLGIPLISPEFSKTDCTKHSCCTQK